jgi:hypothetical protein
LVKNQLCGCSGSQKNILFYSNFRRFYAGGEQRAAIHGFQEPSTRSNRGFGSRQGTHIYAPVAILMWMLTGEIKKNKSGFAA